MLVQNDHYVGHNGLALFGAGVAGPNGWVYSVLVFREDGSTLVSTQWGEEDPFVKNETFR
jgi:hypothetical protein